MYACGCEIGGGFFAGVCGRAKHQLTFSRPTPTSLPFANGSIPTLTMYLGFLAAENTYSPRQYLVLGNKL
jgi:hypothetical protein